MYLSVGFLRLLSFTIPLSEVLEFLDGYDCIISQSSLNNLMCKLPDSGVYKVSFIMLHPAESTPCSTASFVCVTPKLAPSLHKLPLLMPYILSQIQLLSNSTITSQDSQSEATAVNINPYNGLIMCFNLELLSQIGDDNVIPILLVQPELCAFPTIVDVFNKSFISTIPPDWQGNSIVSIKRCNNNDRIFTLCFSKLSRARNVKSKWNLVEFLAVQILPDLMDTINEYLGMQVVFLSDSRIGGVM